MTAGPPLLNGLTYLASTAGQSRDVARLISGSWRGTALVADPLAILVAVARKHALLLVLLGPL